MSKHIMYLECIYGLHALILFLVMWVSVERDCGMAEIRRGPLHKALCTAFTNPDPNLCITCYKQATIFSRQQYTLSYSYGRVWIHVCSETIWRDCDEQSELLRTRHSIWLQSRFERVSS